MQISKTYKILSFSFIFALTSFSINAQNIQFPSMPEAPSISTPSMPSMPSMGTPYYKPQLPGFNSSSTSNASTTQSNTSTKSSTSTSTTNNTSTSLSTLGSLSLSDNLSASDVTSLYQSGLFDNLSSLLTGSSSLTSTTDSSTNILLQQILVSLEQLKNQNGTNTQNTASQNTSDFNEREPAILRFRVNGNSIVDSLKTVFFSELEADGTFLLTADRVFYENKKPLKETIYLLFKTKRNIGTTTLYTVVPTLMQDTKNENSFLYRMCEQVDIEAQKTGNLVAVHLSKEQFSLDILLDLDN